jgi:hypothetical protein
MRKLLAGAAVVMASIGVATTAGAAPTKNVESFFCAPPVAVPTQIVTAGRNGWINGVKYQALEYRVTGIVTTPEGESVPVNDSKVWGGGATGASDEITCFQLINDSDPTEGTFVGSVTVIIRPA